MHRRAIPPALLAAALLARAEGASAQTAPYATQFALDPQHTGRTPHRVPREAPRVLWRARVGHRVFASPARTASGLIAFAGVDGMVHALDRAGVERWAYDAPGDVFASPAALGALTVVAYDGGGVAALDERGQARWTFRSPHDVDASPTVGPDGAIYVASNALTALDALGAVRWSTPLSSHAFGAPALARDGATVIVVDLGGELLYVRARDGVVERRVRVGAPVYGSPLVLEDGGVVVGARDGHVRAYGVDGALRWDATTRDEVHTTPALGRDGTVIVGSDDGGIYGLRGADGVQSFRFATSGRVRASARIDPDGYIVVGSEDDVLYALDSRGAAAWSVTLGADIDSSVLVLPDGALAVGCDDAALYYLAR